MRRAALLTALLAACSAPDAEVRAPAEGTPPSMAAAPEPAAHSDSPATPAGPETPGPAAPDSTRADAQQPLAPVAAPAQVIATLERYDFDRRSARFDMPGRLDEISGLAFSPDGRLFAHDDERGRVHQIDTETGEVGKRWDLGAEMVRDDFEGITVVGDRFFLVSSLGLLYEFREADDRGVSRFRRTDLGLRGSCEVEGLEHDPEIDALLVACKVDTREGAEIVVHRVPMDPAAPRLAPIVIAKEELVERGLDDDFDPSGIAVSPTGTLVLVSGRHEAIIEIDRDGRVLWGRELSGRRHPQTEGIAFGPDRALYLADEKNGSDARVTVYRLRADGVGPGATP